MSLHPRSGPSGPWSAALPWLLFLCLGVSVRSWNFGAPELWIDEYGTWWVAAGGSLREIVSRAVHIQGQSPFYYLIAALSGKLLGFSPWSLRLPSILFGAGTLLLAHPLALRIFRNPHVALLSVATFAVQRDLVLQSQEARP